MQTNDEIETAVIGSLRDLADLYDLECPSDLSGSSIPMAEVGGMDSLHAIELIVDISARLGITVDNNVFWDKKGKLRTVKDAVAYLHGHQKEAKAKG
jgi:acyl carrier protein